MAEAENQEVENEVEKEVEKSQFDVMCAVSESLDEIKDTMNAWRKRDDTKKEGDWVMITVEPEKKKSRETKYTWVVHPSNPGTGGPEVCCRAAYVALMHGTAFDIRGDFAKKSKHRAEALGKDPLAWPPLKFPNGTKPFPKKPEDSDEEEESDYVPQFHGVVSVIAVRYKDEIYTADTLTDVAYTLHGRTKMQWTNKKQDLLSQLGIQASRHIKQMDEKKLANGMEHFKEIYKKNKNKI